MHKTLALLAGTVLLAACQQPSSDITSGSTTETAAERAPDHGRMVVVDRPDHSPVLARVDGQPITQALLEAYAEERGIRLTNKADMQRALDNIIDLMVMAQQARQKELHNKLRFQQRLAIKEDTLLSNQLLGVWVKQHPISEEEIRREYQRQVERAGTHQFRLHHILLRTAEEAQQVMEQLAGGRHFSDIVRDFKQVEGAEAGELGWVDKSQLPPPLAEAVEKMQTGQVSPQPVQSRFGWHVLYLEDVRDRPVPELDQVREGIRKVLYRQRAEEYMKEIKAGMNIERLAEPSAAPVP